jgi:hypothetical protein
MTPDWSASGDAGQIAEDLICRGAAAVRVHRKVATGEPALSASATENGNDPGEGAVPETVTVSPVVELNDIQGGPDRLHV